MQSDFAEGFVNTMLGWMRSLAATIANMYRSGQTGSGLTWFEWFGENWIALLITLVALGIITDFVVWLFRWRPYWMWFGKRRIIMDDDERYTYRRESDERFHSRALRYDDEMPDEYGDGDDTDDEYDEYDDDGDADDEYDDDADDEYDDDGDADDEYDDDADDEYDDDDDADDEFDGDDADDESDDADKLFIDASVKRPVFKDDDWDTTPAENTSEDWDELVFNDEDASKGKSELATSSENVFKSDNDLFLEDYSDDSDESASNSEDDKGISRKAKRLRKAENDFNKLKRF